MSNLCLLALCSFLLLRGFKNFFFGQKKLVLFLFSSYGREGDLQELKKPIMDGCGSASSSHRRFGRTFSAIHLFGSFQSVTLFYFLTGGLDKPIQRPYVPRDWRFGHYEMEGLQDPLSRLSRCIFLPFSLRKKRKSQKEEQEIILQPLPSGL